MDRGRPAPGQRSRGNPRRRRALHHLHPVHLLEAPRQLVAAPPALALVMLEVVEAHVEVALPGVDKELLAGANHRPTEHDLLAAGESRGGDAEGVVALAI